MQEISLQARVYDQKQMQQFLVLLPSILVIM